MHKIESLKVIHHDPICGRRLPDGIAAHSSTEYKKRKYFFCSEGCREAFSHRAEKIRLVELARLGAMMGSGNVRWGLA